MLIVNASEPEHARASRLGGHLRRDTPGFATREIERCRQWLRYRRGLIHELLRDFERDAGLPEDRSEGMIAAANLLLPFALPLVGAYNSLTPLDYITSRTCQLYVRADLEPTVNQTLLNTNPAPALVIRGNLTQVMAMGLKIQVDAVGDGTLGNTTLKVSFNNGSTYPITGLVTSATATELTFGGVGTNIWLSCAVGPYDAADEWISTLGSLADQAGTNSNVDFVNANVSTSPFTQGATTAIKNRPSFSSLAASNIRLLSPYVPPDPGTTATWTRWVGNAVAFVATGRLWATGDVNQFCIRQAAPDPTIAQAGAVAVNANTQMTIGTWFGCYTFNADSTTDAFKIGGNAANTPAPAGGCQSGVPSGGTCLFARPGGGLPSTCAFAEFGMWSAGMPTAAELARDVSYQFMRYGVAA